MAFYILVLSKVPEIATLLKLGILEKKKIHAPRPHSFMVRTVFSLYEEILVLIAALSVMVMKAQVFRVASAVTSSFNHCITQSLASSLRCHSSVSGG